MSGARRAASFHLFFKNLPRGSTSEQTDQLDQARIGIFVESTKLQVLVDAPMRSIPQLTIVSFHLRAIEPRLQEQWPHDWRMQTQKQLESKSNAWRQKTMKARDKVRDLISERYRVAQ
jgi:hypothetical protein